MAGHGKKYLEAAKLVDGDVPSVNTLVARQGRLQGYSTDAAVLSGLDTARAAILGAGGAAEAFAAALPDAERFADVRRAALWARDLLDGELGLTSFVRTSGGRGLHVHVGLNRRADFEEVREFAHRVGEVLARRHPDAITVEQRKDKRGRRIYADVMRNAYAQTVAASYGVRARAGAPVATPLSWAEVEDDGLAPSRFTMATIRARLDGGPDPWADFAKSRHGLGEASQRLAKLND